MSLHPYLGYVYTPPAPGEEPGQVAISEDGFLDTRPAIRRRDDSRYLIGIMGGSVAGQLGTWHSEHLRDALRDHPDLRDRELEFIRLGLPGYHQPQQLQQLAYLLSQGAEFDVLINLDGFNEVAVSGALNVPQGAHPLFPMNWSMVALDVPDPRVRRSLGAIDYLKERRAQETEAFSRSFRSRTVLGKLLWRREDRRLAAAISRHASELQSFPVEEIPWFVRGPEWGHDPPGGLIPWCVDVWKRSSIQMQALCDINGIRYVHYLQPNQYLPGSKTLTSEELQNAYDEEGPYREVVEEGYPLLREAGRELVAAGVDFHDLSLLFEGVSETLYVDSCCHFNAEGNRIMCQEIARTISL